MFALIGYMVFFIAFIVMRLQFERGEAALDVSGKDRLKKEYSGYERIVMQAILLILFSGYVLYESLLQNTAVENYLSSPFASSFILIGAFIGFFVLMYCKLRQIMPGSYMSYWRRGVFVVLLGLISMEFLRQFDKY